MSEKGYVNALAIRAEPWAREWQSQRGPAEWTEELARANSPLREVESPLRNALTADNELNALETNSSQALARISHNPRHAAVRLKFSSGTSIASGSDLSGPIRGSG